MGSPTRRARQTQKNSEDAARNTRSAKPEGPAFAFLHQPPDVSELQRAVADPQSASPRAILQLQRAYGNRAVTQLLQAKLAIDPAGDKDEQEADQALRTSAPVEAQAEMPATANLNRQVQAKALMASGVLQLQRQIGNQAVSRFLAQPAKHQPVQKKANNTGLPDKLKAGIETLSGMAMDNVNVHYNSPKPAQFQALAYTQGTDIYVGQGQEKHLPHEAWHVVQQAKGHVKPTMKLKASLPVNADRGLEQEADAMGKRAAAMTRTPSSMGRLKLLAPSTSPAVMRVAQMTFLEKIKEIVFKPDAPRAGPLIQDLAERAENYVRPNKTKLSEDDFGPEDLKNIAKSMDYEEDYAVRLAKQAPFEKTDIPKNTEIISKDKSKTHVESFKQTATDPDRHQLVFSNEYSTKGDMEMMSNYRNPLLTNFKATDVVEYQRAVASSGKPIKAKSITRKNIQSESGQEWLRTTIPEKKRKGNFKLSAQQLKTFISDTDNGKSSAYIAKSQGYVIKSGKIFFKEDGSFDVQLKLK